MFHEFSFLQLVTVEKDIEDEYSCCKETKFGDDVN